jgi:hypothetical protein
MLTESQIAVLEQIARRRMRDGRSASFETRAIFFRLMEGAMYGDPTLTREQFMKEAREVLEKVINRERSEHT